MKIILTSFVLVFFIVNHSMAQPSVMNVTTDYVAYEPGEIFPDTTNIRITNDKLPVYDSVQFTRGLHFKNGVVNTMTHNFTMTELQSSPMIGVHGEETVFRFEGEFYAYGGQSQTSILLTDKGRFVLGSNAFVDLINSAYFTRQFWVWGDGSGVFEIEEGFVADQTQNGTVPEGMGSLRFSRCNVITHSSEGLPMGYRPNIDTDTANINSHFVFEGRDSSVWKVKTNPQDYRGGLWIDASMIVETAQELTISGIRSITNYSQGGSYTNWGGVMMRKNLSMTKRGLERLVLSGDHGYDSGAIHSIEEGMIEYQTDPFTDTSNVGYMITYKSSTITSPNLKIEVADNATAYFNTPLARIDSIAIAPAGTLRTKLHNTIQTNKAVFNGTLEIIIPDGTSLQENDTFFIFAYNNEATGTFAHILLDDLGGDIQWDLSSLYSDGFIYIQSGSGTANVMPAGQDNDESGINIFPNPATNKLFVKSDNHFMLRYELVNITGKVVLSGKKETREAINIEYLPEGLYFLQLFDKNNDLIKSKKIIKI